MTGSALGMDVRMRIATWPVDAPRGAVTAFCREQEISRSRFYEIRALASGVGPVQASLGPTCRRQRPDLATPAAVEQAAIRIRKELADQGWDHGPLSVRQRMLDEQLPAPSRATLARLFTNAGMVIAQPQKRPRTSWRRFSFELVHQCWQLDATEWMLSDDSPASIFQLLDDCSRYILGSEVDTGETSAAAVEVFSSAVADHQAPQLLLTDNGMAMNPQRRGLVSQLALSARSVGTTTITSRVNHPQTCGKNEGVHSTLKRWLRARPRPATIAELSALVGTFDEYYNRHRPHQALNMATPALALQTRARAVPPLPCQPEPASQPTPPAHDLRTVRVKTNGSAPVKGYYIGLGSEWASSDVLAVVEGTTISLFDPLGTHLRTVKVTPDRRYYGTGRPKGGSARQRFNATINTPKLSGTTETVPSGPK